MTKHLLYMYANNVIIWRYVTICDGLICEGLICDACDIIVKIITDFFCFNKHLQIHNLICFQCFLVKCLFLASKDMNLVSQNPHTCRFRPVWRLVWLRKWCLSANCLSQTVHLKGFTLVWVRKWRASKDLRANAAEQSGNMHLNCRSPVCVFMWFLRTWRS